MEDDQLIIRKTSHNEIIYLYPKGPQMENDQLITLMTSSRGFSIYHT